MGHLDFCFLPLFHDWILKYSLEPMSETRAPSVFTYNEPMSETGAPSATSSKCTHSSQANVRDKIAKSQITSRT